MIPADIAAEFNHLRTRIEALEAKGLVDPAVLELRQWLIGDNVTISNIAAALMVTERSIYQLLQKHHIPFVTIFGKRYISPASLEAVLLKPKTYAANSRGRPRKTEL